MATDNKSPSYLAERERARRIIADPRNKDAALWIDTLKKNDDKPGSLGRLFNDDKWMDWEAFLEDTHGLQQVAWSNRAAVEAVNLGRQTHSNKAPVSNADAWQKIASIPMQYLMRKIVETMDPEYWNDPRNFLREVLENPWFATVPLEYVRAELERYYQGTKQEVITEEVPA